LGEAAGADVLVQGGRQPHPFLGHALRTLLGHVLVGGQRHVTDVAAGRPGDLRDHVGEGHQPRAAELVAPAGVPVLGECGDRHLGDVLGVDERLLAVPGRQPNLAAQYGVEEEVLAEVLRSPARNPGSRSCSTGRWT
jgi:hypothetical protein